MITLKTKMLYLDIEKLNKLQPKIDSIFENNILQRKGEGSNFMDWIDYQKNLNDSQIKSMEEKVEEFKTLGVEHLLVIGIGGSYLGAQAAIDFTKGKLSARDQVLFIGTDMSQSHYEQVDKFLDNKKYAICVISKSGGTLEPSFAFNYYVNKLIKTHKENHKKYVVVITGNEGILRTQATHAGFSTFEIPDGIGGRFSVMTPVGLFPMIFAGIDVRKVLKGANMAREELFSSSNIHKNSAFYYAATRYLLNKKPLFFSFKPRITHEIFTYYDYDLDLMSEWWKQLFAESEGKTTKRGLFPLSVFYSRDLHSLGQMIQEGPKTFFETTLWIENSNSKKKIHVVKDDIDSFKLNYLDKLSLEEVNKRAFKGVVDAHYKDGHISNVIIELKDKTEQSLGYLFYWYFVAVTMSAYLMKVNPFNQPGVEIYKKNVTKNLKK